MRQCYHLQSLCVRVRRKQNSTAWTASLLLCIRSPSFESVELINAGIRRLSAGRPADPRDPIIINPLSCIPPNPATGLSLTGPNQGPVDLMRSGRSLITRNRCFANGQTVLPSFPLLCSSLQLRQQETGHFHSYGVLVRLIVHILHPFSVRIATRDTSSSTSSDIRTPWLPYPACNETTSVRRSIARYYVSSERSTPNDFVSRTRTLPSSGPAFATTRKATGVSFSTQIYSFSRSLLVCPCLQQPHCQSASWSRFMASTSVG